MGVPKFFRWLSERYPRVIQRYGSRPVESTYQEHFGESGESSSVPDYLPPPDPLSECGLPPPIDRLYVDVNGILHGCSHSNNNDDEEGVNDNISHEEIFQNVCYYLDRLVSDIAKPNELVYFAIDGVAPRAKLNQQRARRYRSGKEGEIEQTVYDAHLKSMEKKAADWESAADSAFDEDEEERGSRSDDLIEEERFGSYDESYKRVVGGVVSDEDTEPPIDDAHVKEIEPGRFAGKFETSMEKSISSPMYTSDVLAKELDEGAAEEKRTFHSNAITPGTEFFHECTEHLRTFVQRKVESDPAWKNLTVIFSGPNTPGEGEHKIMQFIREQQSRDDYNPNLRHCIVGQDGDLIMLALATHEPNTVLLRERVIFEERRRRRVEDLSTKHGVGVYIHNANFEFLHLNVLRDYLAFEFGTSNVIPSSTFDLERTIDDFVFLTFIVGNDFLPHMPAMDIADEAFDLIFYTYRDKRKTWKRLNKRYPHLKPYLTDTGNIVSGIRLEGFFRALGKHENSYYDFKKGNEDLDAARRLEEKYGRRTTPDDDVIVSKETEDKKKFLEMMKISLENQHGEDENVTDDEMTKKTSGLNFKPVLSTEVRPENSEEADAISTKIGQLLSASVGSDDAVDDDAPVDVRDLKGRYYFDKFGFTPFDAEKHMALRKAYIEGLVWNLKYYYEGCASWEWFYPYHYGPMLSDLVGVDEILEEIDFKERRGTPLKPFQQLLACLPPSHSNLLPEPYRHLMTEESSPIADFYPSSFVVDMNGKRWPWEATVLLPFIDSKKLLLASESIGKSLLTETEASRDQFLDAEVFEGGSKESTPYLSSKWEVQEPAEKSHVFSPVLKEGVHVPSNGFPTLRDGLVRSLWRKSLKINVHGTPSRYVTSCLEMFHVPEVVSTDVVATELIGNVVYINYPHLTEAFVTCVSDSMMTYRGKEAGRPLTNSEKVDREPRLERIVRRFTRGEKLTGTGGLIVDEDKDIQSSFNILLHVRPLKGLETLADGMVVKTYANFEIEVPFFVTAWFPGRIDDRIFRIPARLEEDPYNAVKPVLNQKRTPKGVAKQTFRPVHRRALLPTAPRRLGMRSFCSQVMESDLHLSLVSPAVSIQTSSYSLSVTSFVRPPSLAHRVASRKILAPSYVRPRLFVAGVVAALAFLTGAQASSFSKTPALPSLNGNAVEIMARTPTEDRETPPLEFAHGTTTLSFTFQGGIVAAVDSRASIGSFVGSKTTNKVLPIHSHMLGTMAGGAADCSYWIRHLRSEAAFYELSNNGKRMTVARASRILSNILYQLRGYDLSVGTMIMGFDEHQDGGSTSQPQIFYCDDTGMRIQGDIFSVGSGSTFALGILDTERRYNMTENEAVALGIKAIRHATFRDAYSGGFINVFLITGADGWKRVYSEDLARVSQAEMEVVDSET